MKWYDATMYRDLYHQNWFIEESCFGFEGEVKKLRNHTNEFGLTNAIYATGSFLLSSSLDVDSGCSTINVRSLPNLSYEGTLAVDTIERVVCIAATQTENGLLKLVVGGSKLTLLEAIADKSRSSPKLVIFTDNYFLITYQFFFQICNF